MNYKDYNFYKRIYLKFIGYGSIFFGTYMVVYRSFDRIRGFSGSVDFGEHHKIIGTTIIIFGVAILLILRYKNTNQ